MKKTISVLLALVLSCAAGFADAQQK